MLLPLPTLPPPALVEPTAVQEAQDSPDAADLPAQDAFDEATGPYDFTNPEPLSGTIFTGRPSFGVGIRTVPIGRFQIETGYTFTQDEGDSSHTLPTTLLRVGLTDTIEGRLSTPGFTAAEGADNGFGDLVLGVRFEVQPPDGWVPGVALQPQVTLPTGDASPSDDVDPSVIIPLAWTIDERTSVGSNLGLLAVTDDSGDTEATFTMSALISRAATDRLSFFGEYFAVYPGSGGDQQSLDFGALYLLTPNVQLDAVVGFGLNEAAADFFTGAGVSFRF
ncbi:MAG: transporter [Planctomycetota bacterium]